MHALLPFLSRNALPVLLSALTVSLSGAVIAQDKGAAPPGTAQQEPPVVLKVTTRLVTVDVVARDRHGNPVRDLKAEDFQVFEQKGAQQIASFRLVDRSLSQGPDVERAALQIPAGVFTNLVTTQKLSAPPTILLVDGLNTDAGTQMQARQKMVQLLGSAPTDVPVAVFLMGRRLYLLQSFTTDTKLLREAAQRAMSAEATNVQIKDPRDDPFSNSSLMDEMGGSPGQSDIPGGAPGPMLSGGGGSGGGTPGGAAAALMAMKAALMQRWEKEQYAESVDMRVKMTLDALRTIARHVSGYPGRKNLIWISSAFPLAIMPDASATLAAKFTGTRNYAEDISGVASALTDAQIAVYPVDPRGIETEQQFAATTTGRVSNPFSEGATLNRESGLRFADQQSMKDLAAQTGGQVCLNNNDLSKCIRRAIDDGSSYYELTYYPADKNWRGEFRRISIKARRSGVQLSYREGYFARSSDSTIAAAEAKDTDSRVMSAACNDFLSATSILMSAKAVPPDQPGQAKYFLAVDPNALSFGAPEGGVRALHLELGACMFNAHGSPLQYFRQSVDQKFSESEYRATIASGITHTMSLAPKPETTRVRLLVCDTATGMIGSVDVPYPAETSSSPVIQAENRSDAASQPQPIASAPDANPPAGTPAHVIKFHDKDGRTGILQWDIQKISYSGDLSPDASARGMFDSLWGKSYACYAGKLVSTADKATLAKQPLHFKSENHGVDVYLDGDASVKFSGDLVIDPSVRPLFEALRRLYQCK
ncbi:MAG TPA: VWA domain-containing protein [Candidatus Acidoferrum sp.]|nr:VWA domain-containing protein [Candidatus Acidoferrum sp.]